jgi:radical SAM superfamily enzyme YgiQ (UPF0313 family)
MRTLLINTYELGHQPFGIGSTVSWLREAGTEVDVIDLAVDRLDEGHVVSADLVAFYVPMHTATRIAIEFLGQVKRLNPSAHICFFGLYAPVNEGYLRSLGVQTVLGGEWEERFAALVRSLAAVGASGASGVEPGPRQELPVIGLERLRFRVPDRTGMPPLRRYAQLERADGERRTAGYTEATRGCKHLCRHCPIVPVYGGRFRVVQREVVLEDVRRQVAVGAEHVSFGDPDFFNGPTHALAVVRAVHDEFPDLTYDVTIKIEHLKRHQDLLPELRDTGCVFVTSAVEALDEPSLTAYEKNHTAQDFIEVAGEFRRIGLALSPTFVTFSPWTTPESLAELLWTLAELELVDSVPPVQYAIRLLIPAGSRLLELPDIRDIIGPFDEAALVYPWKHGNPVVDELFESVRAEVEHHADKGSDRREVFLAVWELARQALAGTETGARMDRDPLEGIAPRRVPSLTEAWYCCAEPTQAQLRVGADRPMM